MLYHIIISNKYIYIYIICLYDHGPSTHPTLTYTAEIWCHLVRGWPTHLQGLKEWSRLQIERHWKDHKATANHSPLQSSSSRGPRWDETFLWFCSAWGSQLPYQPLSAERVFHNQVSPGRGPRVLGSLCGGISITVEFVEQGPSCDKQRLSFLE